MQNKNTIVFSFVFVCCSYVSLFSLIYLFFLFVLLSFLSNHPLLFRQDLLIAQSKTLKCFPEVIFQLFFSYSQQLPAFWIAIAVLHLVPVHFTKREVLPFHLSLI